MDLPAESTIRIVHSPDHLHVHKQFEWLWSADKLQSMLAFELEKNVDHVLY